MASETPAGHLARLKVTFPLWQFWRGDSTGEFWAAPPAGHPQQALISAPDLPALEAAVIEAEGRHQP